MRRTAGSPRRRARLFVIAATIAAVSYLAPAGPAVTSPAGAWGSTAMNCSATGSSGKSGSTWRGITSGSNCGDNWVRFRSWGFYGAWGVNAVSDPSDPTLWGGADHKACFTCGAYQT